MLNADGMSPLAAAVRSGNLKLLGVLLQHGALTPDELNMRDEHGYTALHWAVREASDAALAKVRASQKLERGLTRVRESDKVKSWKIDRNKINR